MPNASRDEKLWPEAHWIAVGQRLQQHGWTPVVLWGGDAEHQRAQRIAAGCGAVVPPFLSVQDAAGVLGHARCIVGLDTGFTHLGAAFGRPTVGIYCDHDPGLAGITGPGPVASIGGKGVVPSLDDVMRLVEGMLS
jgi:heptosyltransferase-1